MGAALTLCVPTASAVTFTVNTEVDGPDDNPGDGLCATSSGACTLRAAIEETNVLIGPDTVDLPAGQYLVGDPTRLEPVHNPLTVLDSLF
ncbi:MAG TPA: CSLREA domain-containing protein, partial [Polyangiaceae bacterium]|nr:CSLREA domain-containing protein [Polyangiaceae bacterium]